MEKSYIVRVDFYPDGRIIPLGITDNQGNTTFIQKSELVFSNGNGTQYFECITKNMQFSLEFKNGKWHIENIKKRNILSNPLEKNADI